MNRTISQGIQHAVSRLSLLTAFGAMFVLAGCGGKGEQKKEMVPTLPVMQVRAGSADIASDYPVRLEGRADAEIRPQVDGVLQEILVREGQLVQRGQPLFRIDDATYREQYNTSVAAQHAADAQASVAKVNADRLLPLVENKVVAPVQLTTARAQSQAAQAMAAQAAAMARAARINLGHTVIKAPVDGYIGRIPYRQGTLLTRNQAQPLTTLSDTGKMYAIFSISEAEFARFRNLYPGRTIDEKVAAVPPVALTLSDGSPYPEPGRLESLSGDFDQRTGSIGMRVSFPNNGGLLRSGNSGTVSLNARFDGIILVPQSATVDLQDKLLVFLLQKGNKVKQQVISVSGRSGPDYIVSGGLKPGDTIVTAGIDKLKEGASIKPMQPAGASGPATTARPATR